MKQRKLECLRLLLSVAELRKLSICLLIWILTAMMTLASATDYCSRTICNEGLHHIACGHNGKFAATCAPDAALVNINSELKAAIVNQHNAKRNHIAGGRNSKHSPACRMATMQWDDELAYLASLNVKQCAVLHDECHNTDAFRHSGQSIAFVNFYKTPNDKEFLIQAVDLWYKEVSNSKMKYIRSFPRNYNGHPIGHFTVMMADRNIRVGCAAATYSVKGSEYKAYLVVCNYATTNMVKFPIYASCKKPGTSCTSGRNPDYPNLCSASESYDVNAW